MSTLPRMPDRRDLTRSERGYQRLEPAPSSIGLNLRCHSAPVSGAAPSQDPVDKTSDQPAHHNQKRNRDVSRSQVRPEARRPEKILLPNGEQIEARDRRDRSGAPIERSR